MRCEILARLVTQLVVHAEPLRTGSHEDGSILAGLMLHTSLSSLSPGAARVAFFAHLTLWPLSLSEVAAAFWGTNKALAIAGAQAGAPGGAPWQESLVIAMHAIPALALMAGWAILAWGMRQRERVPVVARGVNAAVHRDIFKSKTSLLVHCCGQVWRVERHRNYRGYSSRTAAVQGAGGGWISV